MTTPARSPDPAAEAVIAAALDTFQKRDGYQKAVIVEILEDFGAILAAPLLADIAALRTRAEEAEAQAIRINVKLGELNAKVKECLPPAEMLIAEREFAEARAEAATADRDRLAEENARLREALTEIANACPVTCDMTIAHEMADTARRALTATGGTNDAG